MVLTFFIETDYRHNERSNQNTFYGKLLLMSLEYKFYDRKLHQVNQIKETATQTVVFLKSLCIVSLIHFLSSSQTYQYCCMCTSSEGIYVS